MIHILILLCGLWTPAATGHAELVDRILAIVNDDIILLSDFENATAAYRQMMKSDGYSDLRIQAALEEQRPMILDQLINQKLIQQQVEQHGIKVSEDEVDASIERFQRMKGLTGDRLNQFIKLQGLTRQNFREQIKDELLQMKLLNREVRSKIVVTDEDVRDYYEANKDQYAGKTNYHLRHILMKVPAGARDRVYGQMKQLHQRLEAGESFAELAKVYSQAPTAEDGGDLGFFQIRHLAEGIRKELTRLQAGQFTPVLETDQGYQIFYVEEITSMDTKTIEEVTPEIQDILYSEKREQRYRAWLKELRQKAHIQILE